MHYHRPWHRPTESLNLEEIIRRSHSSSCAAMPATSSRAIGRHMQLNEPECLSNAKRPDKRVKPYASSVDRRNHITRVKVLTDTRYSTTPTLSPASLGLVEFLSADLTPAERPPTGDSQSQQPQIVQPAMGYLLLFFNRGDGTSSPCLTTHTRSRPRQKPARASLEL